MKASGEGFYLHIGRGWAEALADVSEQPESRFELEQLYAATAYVDVMIDKDLELRLPRVARVLPFLLSFIDQLTRAFEEPGLRLPVSDGAVLLHLQWGSSEVELATEDVARRVGVGALVAGLRRAVHEVHQDVQELPVGAAVGPLARQLALADTMLARMEAPGPYRRRRSRRPLHTNRELDRDDELRKDIGTPPTRVETFESLIAEPCYATHVSLPCIEQLQFLALEHSFEAVFDSEAALDIFFGGEQNLVMLFRDKAIFICCVSGLHYEVRVDDDCVAESPRRVGDCIVAPTPTGMHSLHNSGPWEVHSPIMGSGRVDELEALVTTKRESLAYLRGCTVYDAPTGAALLHDVEQLLPRLDSEGEVVGWYALDSASEAIWWDGDGDVALLHQSGERIVSAVGTRHGVVALCQSERMPTLRWITPSGEIGWERAFENRGGEGYGHYRLRVWPSEDDANSLTFAVVAGPIWWAFRLHTVTRLATLVLHHRESAPVRLEVAANALVVATGTRLRAYPLEGRAPEPLWEESVPSELGLLSPVFPMHVRGDLIAYATSHAVVRKVRSGELLAKYNGNWSAVFDLRLDEQLGLTVVGAVPGHQVELYRAEAVHWLGVVATEDV